jgi:hypothetical protein
LTCFCIRISKSENALSDLQAELQEKNSIVEEQKETIQVDIP